MHIEEAMASCPLAREDFLAKAEPLPLRVGGHTIQPLRPRLFSTGSFGWCSSKVFQEIVASRQLCVQLNVTAVVRGSKDAPMRSKKPLRMSLAAASSHMPRRGILARLCGRRSRPAAPRLSKVRRSSRISIAKSQLKKPRPGRWSWRGLFGRRQQPNVDTFFFPDGTGKTLLRLVTWLESCQSELDLAMFTFTDDRLADVVLRCHQRGVRVRIIVDDEQAKCAGADGKRLADAGIPVRHDASAFSHMHHKFAVVDGMAVLTGSFNWTVKASKTNREHAVVIHDRDLAGVFKSEFEKLWCEFQGNTFAH